MNRNPDHLPTTVDDAEALQAALLHDRLPRIERAAGAFERLGPYLFSAVCVFAAIAAGLKFMSGGNLQQMLMSVVLLITFVLAGAAICALLAVLRAPRWLCIAVAFVFAAFITLMRWI